jgi:16S rRNA (guanine527-N7)-methyltransferase
MLTFSIFIVKRFVAKGNNFCKIFSPLCYSGDMQTAALGLLREGLDHFDVPAALPALSVYLEELLTWNKPLGLTAGKSAEELVSAHIFDSLAALPVLRRLVSPTVAPPLLGDVGSGAGFPGLPLAAALPRARFVLIERMEKRADFLRRCVRAMGLTNVTVEQRRAEDAAKADLLKRFDVAVFRALHPLSDRKTLTALLALIKTDGVLAAYKGRTAAINDELDLVKILHPDLKTEICPLENPYLPDHERHLVLIRH